MPRGARRALALLLDLGAIVTAVVFIGSYFPSNVMLLSTITNGGDMGTHYYPAAFLREHLLPHGRITGWCPGNYCGYPLFQFYFPLPFVLMGLVAFVIGLPIAFKLVTVLGVFLLPVCSYLSLRLARVPFPGPAIGALACLPFLFMEANSMWGGNIPSTLAGEFTFSLGLALAVLFLGVLRRTVDTGRGRIGTGVLVAAVGFAHGYTLLWGGFSSLAELVALRGWWRRLGALVSIHGLGLLLMGFWIVPLLAYAPWTTAYSHVWIIRSWREILPPILWPAAIAAVATLAAVGVVCLVRREPFPRALATLWFATAIGGLFYFVAKVLHVVDIRFFPFLQLGLCLAAAAGIGYCVARLPVPEIWPVVAALAILPFVQARVTFIGSWIQWNYSGFERKAPWPTLRGISEHLRGTYRDPRVVYEHSPDHEAMGTIRVFENLPLFSGRSTLEGLYMQANSTSPFVFYTQSEISHVMSCPFPEWGCSRPNLERGVAHLRMFNVSQYIVKSALLKAQAARHPGLVKEASFGSYEIYRLTGNDPRYAIPLATAPVPVATPDWKEASYRWFKQATPETPVPVFVEATDDEARAAFGPAHAGLPATLPAAPLGPLPPLREEMPTPERLVITGTRPGHPILVRISYHPRWRTTTGERVWLAAPSFMLVVPKGERVELVYGGGAPVTIGTAMSVLGWLIVAVAVLPIRRRVVRALRPLRAVPPMPAAARLVAWTGTWSGRVRGAVLAAALLAAVGVFALGAVASRAGDADGLYRSAQRLYDAGRLAEALQLFREAQRLAPLSNTAIHSTYFEAITLLRQEDFAAAESAFRRLLERFPEAQAAPEALYHVGICRMRQGDTAGAVAAWERTRTDWPDSPWATHASARLAEVRPPSGG